MTRTSGYSAPCVRSSARSRRWAAVLALIAASGWLPVAEARDPIMELLAARGVVPSAAAAASVVGEPIGDSEGGTPNASTPGVFRRDDEPGRRSAALVYAMAYVGVPYQRGGTGFEQGVDCSGFVQVTFWESAGIRLPRRSVEQAQATQAIEPDALEPGDLVFFNTQGQSFSHVGIYVGQGRFIHSPRTGAQVRLERLDDRYWRSRFDGARRVIGGAASG
jgi:cell wall-associated NlpC family hydrolase